MEEPRFSVSADFVVNVLGEATLDDIEVYINNALKEYYAWRNEGEHNESN